MTSVLYGQTQSAVFNHGTFLLVRTHSSPNLCSVKRAPVNYAFWLVLLFGVWRPDTPFCKHCWTVLGELGFDGYEPDYSTIVRLLTTGFVLFSYPLHIALHRLKLLSSCDWESILDGMGMKFLVA